MEVVKVVDFDKNGQNRIYSLRMFLLIYKNENSLVIKKYKIEEVHKNRRENEEKMR